MSHMDWANNGAVGTYWPDGTSSTVTLDPAHRPLGHWDSSLSNYEEPLNAVGGAYLSNILDPSNNVTYRRDLWTDSLGRRTYDTSHQTGASWQYSYDPVGNLLTITDPLSNVTTRTFDALNRLSTSTDASSGVVTTTYDAHDRPLTVKDANGNTTSFVYDGFGDVIQQASPDTGTTVFHYDGDANLTSKTDAASVVTNWTYDALDRPLTTTYPADSSENVAFTYDQTGTTYGKGIGRLTSFTDAAGSVTRSYDEQGNMLTEKRTIGSTTYPTTYSYNSANRLASITYPSGTLVTYTRDTGGRISNIATQAPGHSSVNLASGITYMAMGPVNAITAFNGDSEAFTYDLDYRMTSLITTATNGPQHQAFTYDNADNLKTITDTVCTSCSATYGYDVLNRLTSAASWYGSYAYTRDHNGNFLTNNEQGYAGTYAYTAGTDHISSVTISGTAYPVSYTANGNISSFTRIPGQATTLTYNKANELASSTGFGTAASYGYDAFRHRVTKTDSGSSATLFFYDQDGNTIEEIDGGGTSYDYFYLNGRAIGALTSSTNTLAFLHGDKLGSPELATDASAKVSQSFTYSPYAYTSTVTHQSGAATITQNNRFPGQFFDPETLLNHNGYRDFSPALGQYVEADPIGLNGGMNPYRYAGGNPTSFSDPLGLYTAPLTPLPPSVTQEIGTILRTPTLQTVGSSALDGLGVAAARFLGVLGTLWPTSTAPPELDDAPQVPYIASGADSQEGQRFNNDPNLNQNAASPDECNTLPYSYTNTVLNNLPSRPFLYNTLLINELQAGPGVPDPGGVPGALRYDVPGTFNGSDPGTWQLVIDPRTRLIYHFNFVTPK